MPFLLYYNILYMVLVQLLTGSCCVDMVTVPARCSDNRGDLTIASSVGHIICRSRLDVLYEIRGWSYPTWSRFKMKIRRMNYILRHRPEHVDSTYMMWC